MRLWSVLFISFFLIGCGQRIANLDSRGVNIICFGNSITQGQGANPGHDYPALLSQKLDLPVINAGVSGDTTRDALARVQKDVLEKNPRLVIVEFGGNDFLQGLPKEETLSNIERIVGLIQQQGAIVVLAQVRAGLWQDEYLAGFRRIARQRKALLVPNILGGILFNPDLKSDQIHPNDAGYALIAEKIYRAIKPLLEHHK
ncbi:MAG: GDSL-type esterase/lipase family protein [Candidatus Omnitrophica bacterium]|nr:GDSL-type esterase/lipase family protein [Candidatus Omnitrophota bacterium]